MIRIIIKWQITLQISNQINQFSKAIGFDLLLVLFFIYKFYIYLSNF